MKQMMQCAQNNPAEARAMLLQNPQLAYALLQALVVMRVVDPQVCEISKGKIISSLFVVAASTIVDFFFCHITLMVYIYSHV
jgi:hypothetical protein